MLFPEGRLDAGMAPQFEQSLAALEAQGVRSIVIHFAQVSYMSSSAVRVLIAHLRSLRSAGGELCLCCLPDKIARILTLTGLDNVLNSYPSEELAVWALSSRPS